MGINNFEGSKVRPIIKYRDTAVNTISDKTSSMVVSVEWPTRYADHSFDSRPICQDEPVVAV